MSFSKKTIQILSLMTLCFGISIAGSAAPLVLPASQLQSCKLVVSCYGEITPFGGEAPFLSSHPLVTFQVPIDINQPPPSPFGIYQQNQTQLEDMQISCNFMRYVATASGGQYYGNTYFPGYHVDWHSDPANNWIELSLNCTPINVIRTPAALGPASTLK